MSWVATAVVAGTTLYTADRSRKAQKKARREQLADQKQARKAEVFAETEGKGTGQLGQISLEVDDELDEDEEVSSNISI